MRECVEAEKRKCADTMEAILKTHKDLDIWKFGIELVEEIYKITADFPKEEMFGLSSQMRRSVISIPSNISEGGARSSKKEFVRFLYISLGSLAELETQIIIAKRLGFITEANNLDEPIERLRRKLLNFIKYIKNKNA